MTVISTVISRNCTVHASDSLITERQRVEIYKPIEWQRSKIIPVAVWRGAIAYWGLAEHKIYNWSTYDWLKKQATLAKQYQSAEDFGLSVANRLNEEIKKMSFSNPLEEGIGIHFTAYEYVDNYWIPELFLISNWKDTSYNSLRTDGVGLSRETYKTVVQSNTEPEHREAKYRIQVLEYLKSGSLLMFNNGDPIMFNAGANSILSMIGELAKRKSLSNPDKVETYLAIARRPVEIVSNVQKDFCKKGKRLVGGKPHDLAITPGGQYISTTGDDRGAA
jgi:hypothetical protein